MLTQGADNSRPDYTNPSCPTEQISRKEEKKFSSGPTEMEFPATFGGEGGGGSGLVSPLLGQSQLFLNLRKHFYPLFFLLTCPSNLLLLFLTFYLYYIIFMGFFVLVLHTWLVGP